MNRGGFSPGFSVSGAGIGVLKTRFASTWARAATGIISAIAQTTKVSLTNVFTTHPPIVSSGIIYGGINGNKVWHHLGASGRA
jgi:hypothetical protein